MILAPTFSPSFAFEATAAVITSIDQAAVCLHHETTAVGGANAPAHVLVKDYPLSLNSKALVYAR
jgi:hypothetical protein